MGIEVVLSLLQTLLTALQCSDKLTKFSSFFSSKPQLDQLKNTVARIQAVLMDAEAKHELSHGEEVYIEHLKDALYEADDLFDEFLTLARRNELTKGLKERCSFLFNKLESALRMPQEVKKIKSKLDAIADDNRLINFHYNPEPLKKRRPETCSYVLDVEIIGRDADLEKIVGLLLQSDVQHDVSFLSIVGIGGLGKTALAQLVFNNSRVTTAFPLKLWTCISDLGQQQLDIDGILRKILASISGVKNANATFDQVQRDVRAKLAENRYLLVLDDVWTEDREQWCSLTSFLMGGQRGSKILVTTRSKNTAEIMGNGSIIHGLQGLSEKDSWQLFQRIAFGDEQPNPPTDLLEIGQEIVVQCANIPLAIRVMGSLLYGQDKSEWRKIQKHRSMKMNENNNIMAVLKLSYQQLQYSLKSCFVYCAIFPKDYVMKKKTLMRHWIAQGYIIPDEHENMEDVAEMFFMVLLRRCFFQDIKEDEFGDIYSCKVHDLMHDVAQEVAGNEICMSDTINGKTDKKIRHVHLLDGQPIESTFNKSNIRSYLQEGHQHSNVMMDKNLFYTLLDKWKYLRVLSLIRLDVNSVPSSIGELIHLRYIDFTSNSLLEFLPNEFSKLYNLQTLILQCCSNLKELPKNMSKLVNIRVLDIEGCERLSCMPVDIGKLVCLQELTMFVVGKENSTWDSYLKSLEDLKVLGNLKGFLEIKIPFSKKYSFLEKDGQGGYLLNKAYLNHVKFNFWRNNKEGGVENDEVILKELQPHLNVKRLEMWYYQGLRMPQWWQDVNLTNLVKLEFQNCPNLLCLGCIGNLHHLKHLHLDDLENLEFLLENNTNCHSDALISKALEFSFFPSLQTLELTSLPKLKGWWKDEDKKYKEQFHRFPQLTKLELRDCQELITSVECHILENLYVRKVNKNLKLIIPRGKRYGKGKEKNNEREKAEEASTYAVENVSSTLRDVVIDSLKWLNSLQHMEAFQCLHSLKIWYDEEVESLGEGGDVFRSCSSSLRLLRIWGCWKLRSVCGGLEHLTALEMLSIRDCHNLRLEEEEEEEDEEREGGSGMPIPWQSLNHSLRSLILWGLPQMVNLPNWIQNLTSLQSLDIWFCKELKSLPNWMSNLTSLRLLRIIECSEALKERCTDSTGEDWPHIKHIPTIDIKR